MERGGVAEIVPGLGGDLNGGFPEPPSGCTVRVVRTRHHGCGAETRVRLPAVLPRRAVRRFVCQTCAERVDAAAVEELELLAPQAVHADLQPVAAKPSPSARRPRFPDPAGRTWRWLSIPVTGSAVIGALVLLQGGGEGAGGTSKTSKTPSFAATTAAEAAAHREGAALVQGSGFSLALPAGWQRIESGTAAFSAAAADGAATMELWVERAPALDFATFEAQSLRQLIDLVGGAHVVDRVEAPSPDEAVVRLAAEAPPEEPSREVTLRSYGPFRYHLTTTLAPDARARDARAVRLVHSSLTPEAVMEDGG